MLTMARSAGSPGSSASAPPSSSDCSGAAAPPARSAPEPHRGGPPPALGPGDLQRLADLVREQPDATLEQLKQRGGFQCSLKTLWYALDRLGLTRKKKSLHAEQRDRPDVQAKRDVFRQEVGTIEPEKLVFVDETGVTTAMTPAYARAPRGQRVVDSVPASWETVTVIAALGLEGSAPRWSSPGRPTRRCSRRTWIRCWCRNCTRGTSSSSTTSSRT